MTEHRYFNMTLAEAVAGSADTAYHPVSIQLD